MIKLDTPYVLTVSTVFNGVTTTVTTDTFFVSQFAADFSLGCLYATIMRGTITDGVFVANLPPFVVTVNPDGSFQTADGTYTGTLDISTLVTSLKTQLDQFVLSSGLVTGTII